jgi:hypothetical protein
MGYDYDEPRPERRRTRARRPRRVGSGEAGIASLFSLLTLLTGGLVYTNGNVGPQAPGRHITSPSPVNPSPSPSGSGPGICGDFSHVYHPDRLRVLKPCVDVTGVVDEIRPEADGDFHVRVHVDPGFEWTLNDANRQLQHGDLVVEPVCVHTVTQADAKAACSGYQNPIEIPAAGTHVLLHGPFVLDQDHGWQEIHPLTQITVTGGS